MIRRIFKSKAANLTKNPKIAQFLDKHHVPREFLSFDRRSVSKGLLVGLFIAFIPMPFQMLAVLAVSPFVRFNIPIALAMCWLSNPLTMPPMYYMEYLTGCWLLHMPVLDNVELTLDWFKSNLEDIFVPLYVGTFFYSVTVAPTVYFLVNWLWKRSVHKARRQKR